MCGINGILAAGKSSLVQEQILAMNQQIIHRGPDSNGVLLDNDFAFGSVRLAIVDPSAQSNQPMSDINNRFSLTFNGEIYNYKELRSELSGQGVTFQTDSDTEVVLKAFEKWGQESFSKMNGMWAIAIHDHDAHITYLSRDRFGEKPLFWAEIDKKIYFSSEIKAIIPFLPSRKMNENYFRSAVLDIGLDAGIETSLEGVHQIKPGTTLSITRHLDIESHQYWKLENNNSIAEVGGIYATEFSRLFHESVELRMRVDTPLAVSLSAGLDSTSVLSAISRIKADKGAFRATSPENLEIEAFGIRYSGSDYDESRVAERTAASFGIKFNPIEFELKNMRREVEQITWAQESIVWNSSAIAFNELYKGISSAGFKVVIEGHGSDEYLGGYPDLIRKESERNLHRLKFKKSYTNFKSLAASSNPVIGEGTQDSLLSYLRYLVLPNLSNTIRGASKKKLIAKQLDNQSGIFNGFFTEQTKLSKSDSPFHEGIKNDLGNYMTSAILPQVLRVFDRATMSNGIESRLPFLDHRLVEFVFSLPEEFLLKGLGSKNLLRMSMQDQLPIEVLNNKIKRGFSGRGSEWFTQESNIQELESIYTDGLLLEIPGVNPNKYKELILKCRDGQVTARETTALWRSFSFAVWYEQFILKGA